MVCEVKETLVDLEDIGVKYQQYYILQVGLGTKRRRYNTKQEIHI
jgi:hypothetical protein